MISLLFLTLDLQRMYKIILQVGMHRLAMDLFNKQKAFLGTGSIISCMLLNDELESTG
jgi:hypothetical protein